MPPRGKKANRKAKDDWPSDDDAISAKYTDLQPTLTADYDDDDVDINPVAPKFGKGKGSKKAVQPLHVNEFDLLNATEEHALVEKERKKSKSAFGGKPARKNAPVNAYSALLDGEAEEGEDQEEESNIKSNLDGKEGKGTKPFEESEIEVSEPFWVGKKKKKTIKMELDNKSPASDLPTTLEPNHTESIVSVEHRNKKRPMKASKISRVRDGEIQKGSEVPVVPERENNSRNTEPVNTFALLVDEDESEEKSEQEETVEELGTNVEKLDVQDDISDNVEVASELLGSRLKKDKKIKKSRDERKREKKEATEATRRALADELASDDEDSVAQPYGTSAFTSSNPAAYSYASGQPLGPEGTNPVDAIAVTGNLLSPPNSRDLQFDKLSVSAFGKSLIKDSALNLISGRRYGLIAPNGSGKSTLLHAIACGLVQTPPALDVYLLDREFTTTDMTSVEAVLDIVVRERTHLEDEMSDLFSDPDKNAIRLDAIQMRLEELEQDGAERRAEEILKGLGFSEERMKTKTKDLSGGWRMRISLARILFVKPSLMMLDEPTNHLDLEAVVWLEEYLLHNIEGHILIMTSHSQDTLNEVCTDIIHLYQQRLDSYQGNYDTFVKVRAERDTMLQKRARKEQKDTAKLQQSLGKTGSKQQEQAKTKLKAMEKKTVKDKEKDKILQEEIIHHKDLSIQFQDCGGGIPKPALKFRDVDFKYPGQNGFLFQNLNFGIDLDSRVALVGPNGAGKTTLIKLMLGRLEATSGDIARHHHLRLAHFHQHMGDQLDLNISAVSWLQSQFPEAGNDGDIRRFVGRYGLTGKSQVIPMRQLSDGQRRRVLFAWLGMKQPHILLMDEPTNALDLETIDALAEAIKKFDGGVVLISHDFRLIDQVADEVWIVDHGMVSVWEADIREYKKMLKEKIRKEREDAAL